MATLKKRKTSKKNRKPAKTTQEIHQEIADMIIKAMEAGVRPWEQCYSVSKSCFATRVTGDAYKGINRLLLTFTQWEKGYQHPVWMTFRQAKELGGSVKGEKASLSVFFKPWELDEIDPLTGQNKIIPMIKTNPVFNVDQISGLSDEFKQKFIKPDETFDSTPIERAEAFINNIPVEIIEENNTPAFIPSKDLVRMPHISQFKTAEQYYATKFHEIGHWTGGKTRLNRAETRKKAGLEGREAYHAEELTAEILSAFILPSVGINPLVDQEHAPYINDYIQLLKNDPSAFAKACAQAEKAAA